MAISFKPYYKSDNLIGEGTVKFRPYTVTKIPDGYLNYKITGKNTFVEINGKEIVRGVEVGKTIEGQIGINKGDEILLYANWGWANNGGNSEIIVNGVSYKSSGDKNITINTHNINAELISRLPANAFPSTYENNVIITFNPTS